ncbi:PQQ-dependent sugar dehydrogenase [Cryobacterium sp. TmT2-59]|uniref:PQQ-dependent sugar dehydrogenase n=1 Tax=Cryobacterium sp. TmT2-59 TaxID=1259264 RepID=UPI001F547988|nr:PQQ-dependent sugar dehydrogenase [Cryobacterium sp. TmT2-59]
MNGRMRPGGRGRMVAIAVGLALVLGAVPLLSACTSGAPAPTAASETPARPDPSQTGSPAGGSGGTSGTSVPPVRPVGDPVVIASGLEAPWSILRLPDGSTLISERDTALVRELLPDGTLRDAGRVADVRPQGEGGLLGLAALADSAAPGGTGWVYAYATTADDNQIVRMPLLGAAGSHTLGDPEPVLRGIPKAGNHNGGRLGFGPDGLLYATAGDAGNTANAQNLSSVGGKILRMTPTGGVPAGNPFGTLVYSYGHRNPQGIAWDSTGALWASEFGQNTWDELNRIVPGGNYGWPTVEGRGTGQANDSGFIDPVEQWPTSEASPSGLAVVNDTLFMAALRGERLWRIVPSTGEVDDWFAGSFGRLRDVVSGPNGTLWFVSNNTDGRGTPSPGDDRLYQVRVAP